MNSRVLERMTRTDVLAYAETCHATRLTAERDLLAAAYQWAVLHHPDRAEVPAAMREAVHLIHGGDVFPYAPHTGRDVDMDHNVPHSQGGQTAAGNLGPLTRSHHRIKTHAGWQCRQPFPGLILWRDPHGTHYLIDATGTRQITGTAPRDRPPPRPEYGFHTTELTHDLAA